MNQITKKLNPNFNYCYLMIAKKTILSDPYDNIKQTIFCDFRKIK